jgi:hypothetical protein
MLDCVYVLMREDGTFCIEGFNTFSDDLDKAPTYCKAETRMVRLEPGEHWELIVPSKDN